MVSTALRAVGWSFASSALGKLATIVVGVILARMLSPRDFGVYAVAYAALRILVSVNDLGLSLAIVRWPGDPREVAPTVATIAAMISATMYGACYLSAPAYASVMGAPAAVGVLRVLCLGIILDGLVSSPAGLLQRQFRQDLRFITDQANLWLATAVTVALAWWGFGPMSLGIGRVAGCFASLILLIRFSPAPLRFGFSLARARDVIRFGLPVAASIIISFGVSNADQLVVGRMLGVTALGYFVLAANLSSWPVAVFAQPVRNVALAGFARLQHDPPAMRRAFLLVASLLTAVALPVCLTMSGAAVPLVRFAYGDRWLGAAPVLAWLGVLAALQIAFELAYDYFVVLALPRVVFILQLVWLLVLVPVLAAGAKVGGVAGVAQAEIAVAAGVVLPWYLWELRKTGIRGRALARRLQLPATAAAIAGVACWAAGQLIPYDLVALAFSTVAGLVLAGLLIRRVWPDLAILRSRPGLPAGPAELAEATEVAAEAEVADEAESVLSDAPLVGTVGPEFVAVPPPSPDMEDPPAQVAGHPNGAEPAPGPDSLPGQASGNGALPAASNGACCRCGSAANGPGHGCRLQTVAVPPPPGVNGPPPLFRDTAAALGWEPHPRGGPGEQDRQDS